MHSSQGILTIVHSPCPDQEWINGELGSVDGGPDKKLRPLLCVLFHTNSNRAIYSGPCGPDFDAVNPLQRI